ncbi:hypothetical protein M3Y94_01190800 [Aphelenchoides besseyi]|nr:hypothetical protein M3Y94_01190800 [Aphelenchoides besseyi]KAI6228341.1 hypothetical protein M3Y95_00612300 [Aphelenchoides besseyi]
MAKPTFKTQRNAQPPSDESAKHEDSKKFKSNIQKKPRAGLLDFRIVIRNLPFATTKEDIQKLFEAFGSVKEIVLPKCKDARFPDSCAGFGFVQYNSRNVAREAVEKLNFSKFKGRKIAVDWALSKDEYISKNVPDDRQRLLKKAEKYAKTNGAVKTNSNKMMEIKDEPDDEMNEDVPGNSDDDEPLDVEMEETESLDDEDVTDEDESGSDLEEMEDFKPTPKNKDAILSDRPKKSADTAVEEGRVIFLRNLSFDTTNEELKEQMSRFGDVTLAILCKFPGTEQPTGNGFVHFKDKEAADKCLEELDVSGIFLSDRIVEGHRAVPRNETSQFEKKQTKQGKDNRNLKLLRVSLIRPGTVQARGMSEEDAQSRHRLIEATKTKLKNLHMFVSTKRLAIHNLPFTYRDADLHDLCLKHATKNAKICESRVMRNLKGKDDKGHMILGKSKGFGFVEFEDHLDALTCLRNLNNNPDVFTDKRRPIVEFSVENLNALRIQEKRRQAKENPTDKKSSVDKSKVSDQLAVQRTKRNITREGLKAMPKKFGEKIRHRDTKKNNKMPGHLQGVRLNKFKKNKPQKSGRKFGGRK